MVEDFELGAQIGALTKAVETLTDFAKDMDSKFDAHAFHETGQFEKGRKKFNEVFHELKEIRTKISSLESKIKPRGTLSPWNRKYMKWLATLVGVLAPFLAALGFNPEWIEAIKKTAENL